MDASTKKATAKASTDRRPSGTTTTTKTGSELLAELLQTTSDGRRSMLNDENWLMASDKTIRQTGMPAWSFVVCLY